jgi:UPF0716 protein FxsA
VAAVLVVLFLVVPVVEIYVIVQVGQLIGAVPTVLLLLAESAFGAWLVKREGRRAWTALRGAFGTGRLPGRELADAALVLVGGTLLLTPGFVTDAVGFLVVLPLTRPGARRALAWLVARRTFGLVGGGWSRPAPRGRDGVARDGVVRDDVVQGEVVRDEPRDGTDPGRAAGG